MTAEENKHDELPKSNVDIIQNIDVDEDEDDDDIDYIPSKVEEQEADRETKLIQSLKEDDGDKIEKPTLDEKTVKEIDDLWEQMKTQPNNLKTSTTKKETDSIQKNDAIENFVNTTSSNGGTSVDKIVPTKRKRISNMDDIIKKHSTSRRESTLDKSKKLWQIYRQEENIGDELDIQSKNSHIEKNSFLNQAKYNEWKRAQEYRLRDMFKKQNKP